MSIAAFTDIAGCKMVIDSHVGTYTDAGSTPATTNGDIVQQINDQSGQANNWTQTGASGIRGTIATDAILNKRVIRFDGTVPQWYNLPNFLAALTAATVFWLIRPNNWPGLTIQKSGFHDFGGNQNSHFSYTDGNTYDCFGATTSRLAMTLNARYASGWELYHQCATTNLMQQIDARRARNNNQLTSGVTFGFSTTPKFGKNQSANGLDGVLRLGVIYDSVLTADQYIDVGEFIEDNYMDAALTRPEVKQLKLPYSNPHEGGDCEWAFPLRPIGDAVGSGITRGYPILF